MVSGTVWTLLLLAGFAASTPAKRPDWLPELPENWDRPDWWPIGPDGQWVKPEWLENWERPDWWPISPDGELMKPEWLENWERPDWWPIGPDGEWVRPELPENWERPDWWPIGPDGEWVRPELPENWERPDWWPVGPDGEWVRPEWLENWERPDWWPINPDGEFEKPDWWPVIQRPTYVPREKGVIADVTEFPGIVQVEVGYGPIWVQGCAGSVLNSRYILSAARCFHGRVYSERYRRIRAGSSTRNTGGDIVEVERAINHDSFGTDNFHGDITIVRLAGSLTYGPTIQQTAVVAQGYTFAAGLPVTLAGWGYTVEGGILLASGHLHKITLIVTSHEACAERFLNTPLPVNVSRNTICVVQNGSTGRDADPRDIGAPLYYQNILVGVASSGFIVGNATFPVVATAVSPYTDWIVSTAV